LGQLATKDFGHYKPEVAPKQGKPKVVENHLKNNLNPNWVDENIFHVVEKMMDTILVKENGTQNVYYLYISYLDNKN
jgi:hypothetical protein